ncbi:MAG: SET domain-containing protein-lysine N-methyltransferase [Planctomycetia bacterium]|nr:SET domain-containing protein-lysine N-methyltransferase [Planctomycetia bacterium]
MEFIRVLALRGPNVWANFPVLEAWVDLAQWKDTASSEVPGFNDRLQGWLPSLVEHRCSVGERGGFFERLRRGTYLAHILEHVALELQSLAGTPVGFGRTRQTHTDGVYRVAIEYGNEDLARAALDAARELCLAAVTDQPFDVPAALTRLRQVAQQAGPSRVAQAWLDAAQARGVPARLLDPSGLIQLGYGARQCRVQGGQTGRTSAVAASIAYDRELVRKLLQPAGVPVPAGQPVYSAEEAWTAAQELGLPVLLRPRYASGRGCATGALHTREALEAAYARATAENWSVLVEQFVAGNEHRVLVVGNRVAAAVRWEGTGDNRRAVDVTDALHPELAVRVVEAVRAVGLDVAGVDVIAADLRQPLEAQQGVVQTVWANPDLEIHLAGRRVCEAVVDHLYPSGNKGRIPVIAVTGVNGKTTTTRLIAHIMSQVHRPVGMACTEGIYVGTERIVEGDCSGPKSARTVLQHPAVQAAVLETARGGILREGLGFDRCDVAVMTNIGAGDHLGIFDIESPEQLAWVKSTIVASVAPTGAAVLNAADPLVVDMARWCKGAVVYFGRDAGLPAIAAHRAAGGRAVVAHDNCVVLCEGEREIVLLPLEQVPLTHGGRVGFHVENALAAAAAAWAQGVPVEAIAAGLRTFVPGLDNVPARFNLLDVKGVTVVLDYGHNVSALERLIEALEQFPHPWRSIVYSASGDRRNADMVQQGEQLGSFFDRVVLYEDTYMRGRVEGEIFGLFRQGLAQGPRTRDIHDVRGGMKAIEKALSLARPGELLVIQPDIIDDAVEFLRTLVQAGAREISLTEALAGPTEVGPSAAVTLNDSHLGRAAHAGRAFDSGEVILKVRGPRTTVRSKYTIQVEADIHMLPPSPLRYMNHSCEPNCGLLIRTGCDEVELHALRPIAAGEELTLDYDTFEYEIEYMKGPCQCHRASCRGVVAGYKSLPGHLRERYGIYVAEYLREQDAPDVVVPPVVPAGMELAAAVK